LTKDEEYKNVKPEINKTGRKHKNRQKAQAPVAHAYNPTYSGGRNQEDHILKPAPGK
jgi:hypothetical protein